MSVGQSVGQSVGVTLVTEDIKDFGETYVQIAGVQLHFLLQLSQQLVVERLELETQRDFIRKHTLCSSRYAHTGQS